MPGSKEDLLIPLCLISEAGFPSRVGGLQKQELDDDRYPCSQERGDLQLVSVCVCWGGGPAPTCLPLGTLELCLAQHLRDSPDLVSFPH